MSKDNPFGLGSYRIAMDASWLKAELDKPGRSQSALARFMKLDHPSIVNRMVNGTRQIKAVEADQIRAYLNATAKSGAPALSAGLDGSIQPASLLSVRGVVEAGSWREVAFLEADEPETLPAPRFLVDSGAFALKVAGPSMNKFYPAGTYVIVEPWQGGALPVGKHVVVERIKPDGTVETTIKELAWSGTAYELWPKSDHPAHQTPVPFDDQEGVTVRLVGRVIWAISPVP